MKKQESSKKFSNGTNAGANANISTSITNSLLNKKSFYRSGSLLDSSTSALRMFEQIRSDKSISPDKARPQKSNQINQINSEDENDEDADDQVNKVNIQESILNILFLIIFQN